MTKARFWQKHRRHHSDWLHKTDAAAAESVLPYSLIVGQDELKQALEIAHVARTIGGVLVSGERGTAKTTTVRAFAKMVAGDLPVTLPIGATDDRILGGWYIDELMAGHASPSPGLLVEASKSEAKILYIDEVNLLDDYLVNIILDVVSTGILAVQRDYRADPARKVDFTLIGTMNPQEGGLRSQLLDRFGLVAAVSPVKEPHRREEIITTVMTFHQELGKRAAGGNSRYLEDAAATDLRHRKRLEDARERLPRIECPLPVVQACTRLTSEFDTVGHRGELMLIRASRALAALEGTPEVAKDHLAKVAKLVLIHRQGGSEGEDQPIWEVKQRETVMRVLESR